MKLLFVLNTTYDRFFLNTYITIALCIRCMYSLRVYIYMTEGRQAPPGYGMVPRAAGAPSPPGHGMVPRALAPVPVPAPIWGPGNRPGALCAFVPYGHTLFVYSFRMLLHTRATLIRNSLIRNLAPQNQFLISFLSLQNRVSYFSVRMSLLIFKIEPLVFERK